MAVTVAPATGHFPLVSQPQDAPWLRLLAHLRREGQGACAQALLTLSSGQGGETRGGPSERQSTVAFWLTLSFHP